MRTVFTLCCRREKCRGRKNITRLVCEEQKRAWCRISDRKHSLTSVEKAALSERLVMIHISLSLNEIIIYLWATAFKLTLYCKEDVYINMHLHTFYDSQNSLFGWFFFFWRNNWTKMVFICCSWISSAVMGQILGRPAMLCILFPLLSQKWEVPGLRAVKLCCTHMCWSLTNIYRKCLMQFLFESLLLSQITCWELTGRRQ